MTFLGYSSGGLAELFDEEEARRLKVKKEQDRRNAKHSVNWRIDHCAVCGAEFRTVHNLKRCCSKECGYVWRNYASRMDWRRRNQ